MVDVLSPLLRQPLRDVNVDVTSWYGLWRYLDERSNEIWDKESYLDITVLALLSANIQIPLPDKGRKNGLKSRFQLLYPQYQFEASVDFHIKMPSYY